ncbi:two-component system sensor histidine kinase YesM [Natranaerovirga hydrolytica]|uniref:Two-component system sensor histidine kinase YesM n=1 Tax=Natranaerovirga hydrolytica TaxID=680378 RepID=A0A4R1MQ31_9FIRM|nr:histidine kinase [Natranaerovirga hydrolytica]TCK92629.1 two-component system sensor histidine kinase YesM [Natranaerovirga hydrolytica]
MRKSIKIKFIISIAITFLILFVFFTYCIDTKVKRKVHLLNTDLTTQLIDARANQISNWIEQRKIELEMMSNNILTHHMDKDQALTYIHSIYEDKKDTYLQMGIVTYGGHKVTTTGEEEPIHTQCFYKNTLREKATFKISYPIEKEGYLVVGMLYTVSGVNREIEFIYVEVPLEKLIRITDRIDVYEGFGEILIRDNPLSTDTPRYNEISEENLMTFETNIAAARGWSLRYYIDKNNLNQINDSIKRTLLFNEIIRLGLIIVIITILFGSILNPINKLKLLMKKVESGDLTVRFRNKREDEMGSLINSFNNMVGQLEHYSFQEKEMKLTIMQEQIKPHFLYNTLDTIKWVAMEDDSEEVIHLIDSLSTYFRIGLSSGSNFISLDEELEHIDSYLRIQKARFEERLDYTLQYDETLVEYKVLRVILQPIVENAVIHGINDTEKQGKIVIELKQASEDIMITVKNNAAISTDLLKTINKALKRDEKNEFIKGYGLYSVNHRIKLEYGKQYGITLQVKNQWTIATITIPKIRMEH